MRSCGAWSCWPSAFLISVRKWHKKPQMSHNRWLFGVWRTAFQFWQHEKTAHQKLSLRIKRIHCSVGCSRKALGKPNRPLLSIHWLQKRPWGNARSPGLDVIGLILWTRRKLDWVTVCPITRRSAIESAVATLYFPTSLAARTAATWETKNTHRHGADVCDKCEGAADVNDHLLQPTFSAREFWNSGYFCCSWSRGTSQTQVQDLKHAVMAAAD